MHRDKVQWPVQWVCLSPRNSLYHLPNSPCPSSSTFSTFVLIDDRSSYMLLVVLRFSSTSPSTRPIFADKEDIKDARLEGDLDGVLSVMLIID